MATLPALVAGVVAAELAVASCDVPLPIVRTVGEGKVLIILDTSDSMNEVIYHDAYDDKVTYSGNFSSGTTYYVSSDGNRTPHDFKSSWPSTPSAYLVNSDGSQDGWYSGNYLNWVYFNATATQRAEIPRVTRIQVAKQVVSNLVTTGTNVSYGIMRFNGDDGGTLVSSIGTSVATLQSQISGIKADSWTPLAETMVDAMDYFKSTGVGAPLQASCEKAFIIMVTDGHPTQDRNVPAYLQDYDGDGKDPGTCADLGAPFPETYQCSGYVDDVALYLYANDMRPDLSGMQNVTTYVVGFQINAPILQSTADHGGGELFYANNAAELAISLSQALQSIDQKVSAGTAVSVVAAEDQTDNRLYRARYESVTWKGFVEGFALPYTPGDTPVWEAGGLLQSRDPNTRTIFTSSTGTNKVDFTTANAAALTSLLGAADAAAATQIIQYARGTDLAGCRDRDGWKLGDIVDSSPVAVGKPTGFYDFSSYASFRSANLSRGERLYVGANDGMLHCFSTSDGTEAWAYVPKNQLPKLKNVMSPAYCHDYFVNLTPAVYDIYINGNWKTVLVGGEERGGTGLFALDVTDPASGQVNVLWDVDLPQVKGSWSRPTLVRDKTRDGFVLCVGTGVDSLGGQAALLVLDPANGSVLATYNLGSPAAVNRVTEGTAVDRDFDGYDDLLYVGDLTGKVWRVDLTGNPWTVSKLFDNSQSIQAAPTLSTDVQGRILVYFGTGRYLTGADLTTTGSQTFYGLIDDNSGTPITRAGLVDQTNSITAISSGDHGWYVDLVQYAGERVIRPASLIAGTLYVPSFRPKSAVCESGGESWLYSLDFNDGSAADNHDGTENNTTNNRVESTGDGILSTPAVDLAHENIILQNSDTSMITKDIDITSQKLMVRSWRQRWD
jgi:type IV pilus assembly protein PilY1